LNRALAEVQPSPANLTKFCQYGSSSIVFSNNFDQKVRLQLMSTPDQTPNQPESGATPPSNDPINLPPFLVVPPGPEIPSTPDERTYAMILHIASGACCFLVALVMWFIKKDKSRFIDDQGKEAVNFTVTAFVVSFITSCVLNAIRLGKLEYLVYLAILALSIIAGIKAKAGIAYRHKYTFRFLK
jgi:uncharacterized Tic20 family protein